MRYNFVLTKEFASKCVTHKMARQVATKKSEMKALRLWGRCTVRAHNLWVMLLVSATALTTTQVKTMPADETFVSISTISCLCGIAIVGKIYRLKEHIWAVRSVTFSPNDQTLASEIGDGMVRIWQVR